MLKYKKQLKNIYIHIPFCLKKCLYCDFPVYALGKDFGLEKKSKSDEIISDYIKTLKTEIEIEMSKY